jgi:uncharacterized membrane protein
MVTKQQNVDSCTRQFVIRPNCSLSWRLAVRLILGFSALLGCIATGFAFLGAWMILPFAGLEVVVLCIALYICAQRNNCCEVVAVGKDSVTVMRGRKEPEEGHEFQRAWAQVVHEQPVHHWYPSRLLIRSHGREVEVGNCLTEEEREQLACQLEQAIA